MNFNKLTLKTALPLKASLSEYDPISSYMAYDWVIYHATLRALTEVDDSGRLIPGAAQAFYWRGEELVFEFDPRFRTVDGLKITAEDAAISLKRTMILKSNYRGYLDSLLDVARLKTLDDDFPQIRVEGDRLVLRPVVKSPCILEVLASLDFAVYPKSAIDPNTLGIRDFRNTSGPYWVASFGETMVLKANKTHRDYSSDMPQEIEIFRDERDENDTPRSHAIFKEGKVDFIPHFGLLNVQQAESLAGLPGVMSYRTSDLALVLGKYSPKGRLRSVTERRYITRHLQTSVARRVNNPLMKPAVEVLLKGSCGALDAARLRVLKENAEETLQEPCRHLVISVPSYCYKAYEDGFRDVPFYVRLVVQTDAHLDFATYQGEEDEPDIVLAGLDLGHETNMSLLAFTLNTGVFGLTRTAAEKWLIDFASELDAEKRAEMARALHFRALYTDPSAIPLLSTCFISLAQHGWALDAATDHSVAALWKIRRDAPQ